MPRVGFNNFHAELLATGANLTDSFSKGSATLLDAAYDAVETEDADNLGVAVVAVVFIILFALIINLPWLGMIVHGMYSGIKSLVHRGILPETQDQDDGYKKKFVLALFKQKFGSDAREALEGCLGQWHDAMPDLLQKAHIDPEEVSFKLKGSMKNPRALKMWVRHFLSRFMMTHGAIIAANGLAGVGLAECGRVMCGGDLQYQLDSTGLHKCEWSCPAGEHPEKVKSILSTEGSAEAGLENAWGDLDLQPDKFQHSGLWSIASKIPYSWAAVQPNASALKILKMKSPSVMSEGLALQGFRFEGKCSP